MKAKRVASVALSVLLGMGTIKAVDDLYFKPVRNFPDNIGAIEAKYGEFEREPRLVVGNLRFGESGGIHPVYSNTIIINSGLISNVFEYVAGPFFGLPNRDYTVKHELGHLVIHQMLRELRTSGIRPGVEIEPRPLIFRDQSARRVDLEEGIADYIANQMFGSGGVKLYRAQFDFVRPILDRSGIKKGIETLFAERPTGEELQSPSRYYGRIGLDTFK